MSFLSRLFGSGSSSPKDLEAQLKRLEADADNATAGYVGTSYNKAGDLLLREGEPDRALGYYGRAIDAFLEDAQREAARGVANKIIRVRPSAVRTLCTLTWLDLAAQHRATALLHLRDYVSAAKAASQHSRAATQIYAMARVAPESEFVGAVADALDSLDFSSRGQEVRGWVANGSGDAISDSEALSEACLLAAVRSNDRDAVLLRDEDESADDTGDANAAADDDTAEDAQSPDDDDAPADDSESAEDSDGPAEGGGSGKKYRWD